MMAAMVDALPSLPRKGRGAVSNRDGRYEPTTRVAVDDGWRPHREAPVLADGGFDDDGEPALATTVTPDRSRTIITRNRSPDLPFDQSINPYRGCEHGCVYCYARPSHAWLGLSPGLDFESRLFAKFDAAELLAAELAADGYTCKPIAIGTNTDPYQPIERRHRIMRAILEVLAAHDHPVCIVTKSAMVVRDLDLLAPMAAKNLVRVYISVTTLDSELARCMEPRAAAPRRRLEAIGQLARGGVPAGVFTAPMIPGLNDWELERILDRATQAGASEASYTFLRLPLELKALFTEWLEAHYPDRAGRVLALIRESRDGKLNDARFGSRMTASGPHAQMIRKRFRLACRRLGLNARNWDFDTWRFHPPERPGQQLRLL